MIELVVDIRREDYEGIQIIDDMSVCLSVMSEFSQYRKINLTKFS